MRNFLLIGPVIFLLFSCKTDKKGDPPLITLTVSETEINASSLPFRDTLQIISNGQWRIANQAEWITLSLKNGSGNADVIISVSENETVNKKSAELIVSTDDDSKTITINQEAGGSSVEGSSVSVPIGDLPGWKQIFYDDFTKNAPLGSWGSDCDADKIVYTGARGQQWKSYPKCFNDTYQNRPYRADSVLSVKNGVLNFYLHAVDGLPAGANPSPVIDGKSQYQTYGRYTARFRVSNSTLSEYHIAWLLWPESEKWPDDGEEDFPEGSLSGNIGGFHHYAGEGACVGCQDAVTTSGKYTDWHTYTIEWRPGNIKYILDGKVILNTNHWVPDKPMRWQLQTETKGDGSHSGNLMVDWVAVYKYYPATDTEH